MIMAPGGRNVVAYQYYYEGDSLAGEGGAPEIFLRHLARAGRLQALQGPPQSSSRIRASFALAICRVAAVNRKSNQYRLNIINGSESKKRLRGGARSLDFLTAGPGTC
jgi:hypothetical protein